MKNLISLMLLLFVIAACSGPKVYTQRNGGINGKTGSHTVAKTQSWYNHDAAMKRTKPSILHIFR